MTVLPGSVSCAKWDLFILSLGRQIYLKCIFTPLIKIYKRFSKKLVTEPRTQKIKFVIEKLRMENAIQ